MWSILYECHCGREHPNLNHFVMSTAKVFAWNCTGPNKSSGSNIRDITDSTPCFVDIGGGWTRNAYRNWSLSACHSKPNTFVLLLLIVSNGNEPEPWLASGTVVITDGVLGVNFFRSRPYLLNTEISSDCSPSASFTESVLTHISLTYVWSVNVCAPRRCQYSHQPRLHVIRVTHERAYH